MSLHVKVNNVLSDTKFRRVSFRNSIEACPVIEVEPADIFWTGFDVGKIVSIWDDSTKLIEGEIKDISVKTDAGIVSKNAQIHVKDMKDCIASYDISEFTGLSNKLALSKIGLSTGKNIAYPVTAPAHLFAMEKAQKSIPLFNFVQEVCASEGWGAYCNHDTIICKDLINDNTCYSIAGSELVAPIHKINDLNVYGNVTVRGNVLNDRLISDDNPFPDLIFNPSATLDTISITATNENSLLSILNVSGYEYAIETDEKNREIYSFFRINATTLTNTFNPDTVSIADTSENFTLLGYELTRYNETDKIGNQCESIRIFGYINDINSAIKIIIKTNAKTILSYTANKTPDLFLLIAKDTAATANSKNNYLYYENKNISELEQLETIASSLLRETSQKILTFEFKLYGTTVYKPLDRLYIHDSRTEYDGYWTVVDVRINKTADFQITDFKCVRANTAIIPTLNIYVWNTVLTKIKDISQSVFKVLFPDNGETNSFYDSKFNKIKTLTNSSRISYTRGDLGYVVKTDKGKYEVLGKAQNEYGINETKISKKNYDSSGISNEKGGWNSTLDSAWSSGTSATTNVPYNDPGSDPIFRMTAATFTSTGTEEGEIEITFSNDVDFTTLSKDGIYIL